MRDLVPQQRTDIQKATKTPKFNNNLFLLRIPNNELDLKDLRIVVEANAEVVKGGGFRRPQKIGHAYMNFHDAFRESLSRARSVTFSGDILPAKFIPKGPPPHSAEVISRPWVWS